MRTENLIINDHLYRIWVKVAFSYWVNFDCLGKVRFQHSITIHNSLDFFRLNPWHFSAVHNGLPQSQILWGACEKRYWIPWELLYPAPGLHLSWTTNSIHIFNISSRWALPYSNVLKPCYRSIITVTPCWAQWRFKSPASGLFVQTFV